MTAYDKKYYANVEKEPFLDPEWEAAEKSNEKPRYYKQKSEKGIIIRKYKPSIAALVMERTGWILEPLN